MHIHSVQLCSRMGSATAVVGLVTLSRTVNNESSSVAFNIDDFKTTRAVVEKSIWLTLHCHKTGFFCPRDIDGVAGNPLQKSSNFFGKRKSIGSMRNTRRKNAVILDASP